ncbi:hypothetical protein GCM10018952_32180 [Streptosporangium vulgare]
MSPRTASDQVLLGDGVQGADAARLADVGGLGQPALASAGDVAAQAQAGETGPAVGARGASVCIQYSTERDSSRAAATCAAASGTSMTGPSR